MLATAQRVDVETNIQGSIRVGRRQYWRSLGSSVHFLGKDTGACLDVIHRDIVLVWNFKDVESLLLTEDIKVKVLGILGDLGPRDQSPNRAILDNAKTVAGAVGAIAALTAANVHPLAAITIPVTAAAVLGSWGYKVYQAIPVILKCFMAYIIDLTIVMQKLFPKSLPSSNESLTATDVDAALSECKDVQTRDGKMLLEVHREIKEFVDQRATWKAVKRDPVLEKIVELIDKYQPRRD